MKVTPLSLKLVIYFFLVNSVQFSIEFSYNIPIINLFFINNYSSLTDESIQYDSLAHSVIKMTIGPIIGFFLQPIIGALSDHASFSYGRRRPIMILGLGIWFIGSFGTLISSIYPLLPVTLKTINVNELNGLSLCDGLFVIFQIIVAIGINLIQVSYRSFVLDQFDWIDQTRVTLIGSVMLGLGNIIYYGITSIICLIYLTQPNHDKIFLTKARLITTFWLNVISLFVMPITVYLFCHFVNESPYPSGNILFKEHIQNIWTSIKHINKNMCLILIVVFVGWFAWTPIKENTQLYFMYYVFEDKQDLSFLYFNFNRLLFGITVVITGLILFIINKKPILTMFSFNIITGLCAIIYYIPRSSFKNDTLQYFVSLLPLIFSGLCYCQLTSLPYALTRKVVKTDDFGFFVGLVNNSLTLSQLLSQLISIIINISINKDSNDSSESINQYHTNYYMFIVCPTFLLSGISSLLFIFVIKTPDQNSKAMDQNETTQLMK
ncbi:hypothetical protein, conserved [Entamoeba dispar SAW760]|uniref:Sucrose transporter n=1 Tax=Entamoeba dispar (strain ATCC PRA-260 / SAW760) TaxID=370354 RepID=B0EQ74_ENTDS|nr:uncharacterized protein EDI_219160 [Entamoeba dispar SAW760]EDR23297.1 hypothetical protein, conserved [Entamoeba dispar SAW760]|eukprot:EDR23297.1 hypothetical protein, conserved [Entamoeba dispar SAW760]